MKTNVLLLLIISLFIFVGKTVIAVPAYPGKIEFIQPDGTKVNIILKGDERVKLAFTEDGYTLLFNNSGFLEFAVPDNLGDLIPSGIRAKNIGQRDFTSLSFLTKVTKGLSYSFSQSSALSQLDAAYKQENIASKAFQPTGNKKLICILIGFQDKAFTKTNLDFTNLMNQIGYTFDGATGSVKDYYLENSYGQFNITIDVAGPYKASQNMSYYGGNDIFGNDKRPRNLVSEAINLADPSVNFANYDNDGDGFVDGVYVIYAGYGEEAGASANAIWAHAWSLSSAVTKDGVKLQKYSCSAELRGNTGNGISRIGVICHEFGHVLGAPDYYDINYSTGGQYSGTGNWDLMASGSWNNDGATPAHHNGFTKVFYYKWAAETVLNANATITLYNAAQNSSSFYRLNTTTSNEYFFIENREKHLFDAAIPGSGMIIYHIHKDILTGNINATHPQKMYPVSQNATSEPNSTPSSYGTINSSSCAWTGTGKNEFSDASIPSSKSWAGVNTGKPITQILRNASTKTVTFNFGTGVSAPPAPTANAATNVSQTGFSANWSASTGATGYFIDVSTNNTFSPIVSGYNNLNAGNVTTINVSGLTANTPYYYRVRATNGGGTSISSNVITVSTSQVSAPPVPVANVATNITQTGFSANWSASTGATGYFIDVSTNILFSSFVTGYNNLSVGNVTTINVSGLSAKTTYYYRVRATNGGGTSGSSNVITVSTSQVSAPPVPVANVATNITQTGFSANWSASTGATGYFIDVSTNNLFSSFVTGYNNLSVGNVTTINVSGLSANTTYYYRVRATNGGGTSGSSNVITVNTSQITKPSAPVAIAASNIINTGFTARWNASSGATSYFVDVSTNSWFFGMVSGYNNKSVGNVTSIAITGLSANRNYYYRIRANNLAGTSSNSNTIKVTTLLSSLKSGEIVTTEIPDVVENNFSIYPNPFSSNVTINYSIEKEERTTIEIYDLSGKKVKTILNSIQKPGFYTYSWDATTEIRFEVVKKGIYICKFKSGDFVRISKLIYQ